MSTDTVKGKAIPQRSDIDDKHTWNLTDIYPDEKAWEADFARVETMIEEAASFAGKLAESPTTLYDCLELRSRLGQTMYNLAHYAHLAKDLDNRVSRYQELSDRATNLASKAAAAFAYVEPELLQIDETKLLDMAGEFPKTGQVTSLRAPRDQHPVPPPDQPCGDMIVGFVATGYHRAAP